MAKEDFSHCCFSLEASGGLEWVLAWRELGGFDLGLHMARGLPAGAAPVICAFKASSRGAALDSFLVSDAWPKLASWEDDHVGVPPKDPAMSMGDQATLEALAKTIFDQWLEPFGESQARLALSAAGLAGPASRARWREAFAGPLPLSLRLGSLRLLLGASKLLAGGQTRCWASAQPREFSASERDAKLRQFLELL
jgi:hypothetical protein